MLLDSLLGLFSQDMGIDLGTANTLVYLKGKGIVLAEPSVVAVKKGTTKVLLDGNAVGLAAKAMMERTPPGIEAIRPLKEGVITDASIAQAMISYFIRKVHQRGWGIRPRVVIAVPSGINGIERKAVVASAERAGARRVYLVEEPRAAGLGAGLPIQEPIASMVVDVGAGTTEIAILSLADIVVSDSCRVGGDKFDDAIITHVKAKHGLCIGQPTAERVKIEIGSVWPLEEELATVIKGRDVASGLPRHAEIRSEEVRDALLEPVRLIARAVRRTLEQASPELAGDLVERGIVLCGGGSMLRGMRELMEQETGLTVRLAEEPLTCVARGTGLFLENLDKYQTILDEGDDEE